MPATALNMIDMVGIGPFIVAPLVITAMGGPQSLLAWVAGAANVVKRDGPKAVADDG